MKSRLLQKIMSPVLALTLASGPAIAQNKSNNSQKPLESKEDPTQIGKRNINGGINFYSLDKEVAIGRQYAGEVDRTAKIVNDPVITEFVNRIGQNLVLHSDAKVPFTIKVIENNEVNAFALPGGYLYVHTGLLAAAENEAEVAGVLSHEIAHVAARHGVEQASKAQFMNYATIPLIFVGGVGGYAIQQALSIAVPLTFLKFSRGQEKEADRLGAQYMWAAGYDPNAMVSFFEKLQAKEKKKPGTLAKVFSTHPPNGDRIKDVTGLIARFPDRSEYQITSSEFTQVKGRLIAIAPQGKAIDANRPTLKRKPQSTTDENSSDEIPKDERPKLKRKSEDPQN